MSVTSWYVDGRHVTLKHSWWTGRAELQVDGELVYRRGHPAFYVDFGFARRFTVDDRPCAVRVVSVWLWFRKDLFIGDEVKAVEDTDRLPIENPLWFPAVVLKLASLRALLQ